MNEQEIREAIEDWYDSKFEPTFATIETLVKYAEKVLQASEDLPLKFELCGIHHEYNSNCCTCCLCKIKNDIIDKCTLAIVKSYVHKGKIIDVVNKIKDILSQPSDRINIIQIEEYANIREKILAIIEQLEGDVK